jgi:hypothetical protein
MIAHDLGGRRLAALAAIAVAIAAFLGWQAGNTPVEPGPALAATRWSLPTHAANEPDRDLAILNSRRPWNTPEGGLSALGANGSSASVGSAPAASWRLAGIVGRADGNFAMIAIGPPNTMKLEYRAVGDKLPDGSTLVAITPEGAAIRSDGEAEPRLLRLFRGPASATGPTGGKATSAPAAKAKGAAAGAGMPRSAAKLARLRLDRGRRAASAR